MVKRLVPDDGAALIAAILVTFVVVVLAASIMMTSVFNLSQSGRNRTRTQAIATAEAGIHDVFATITKSGTDSLPCTHTGSVASSPATGTYDVTVTYADASGVPLTNFCTMTPRPIPAKALLESTGTVGSSSRKMQSAIDLKPIYGGLNSAMLADALFVAGQSAYIRPALTGEPGDVFSNGPILTLSNTATISGSIYAQGDVALSGNGTVQDIWAKGQVTIDNPRTVLGNVTSSTSSVAGSGQVNGDVRAATTISPSLNVPNGTKTPNSPSSDPPTNAFPLIDFDSDEEQAWVDEGYTIERFSNCPDAKARLDALSASTESHPPTVIRIASVCHIEWNNQTLNARNHLAIITNGSFRLSGGSGEIRGLPSANLWVFQVIVTVQTPQVCSAGSYDITKGQSARWIDLRVFLYTPCKISLEQSTILRGQLVAREIHWGQSLDLTYYQHTVPGSIVVGYDQDIRYFREVN